MTVVELREALRARRVDDARYVLEGLPHHTVAEVATYVARTGDGWEVGVQERARRDALATFPDEASACTFALEEITRQDDRSSKRWWLRWM